VEAQPSSGGITVAGKTFAFDAVCDQKDGQARAAARRKTHRGAARTAAKRATFRQKAPSALRSPLRRCSRRAAAAGRPRAEATRLTFCRCARRRTSSRWRAAARWTR
jgi:hypothetical protein